MHIIKQITRISLISLVLLLILACGVLQSRWGKNQITDFAENNLNIKIHNFSGFLPFSPHIGTLKLQDSRGPWLEAENVSIKWDIDFLPFGLNIKLLEADNLHIIRAPEKSKSNNSSTNLPEIRINKISLPHIKIDKLITGQDIVLGLEGGMRIGKEELASTLQISIPEVNNIYADLQGRLEAEVKLSGLLSAPQAKINAILYDKSNILKLATLVQAGGDSIKISDIEGGTGGIKISGNILYNTNTSLTDGNVIISANHLSDLDPFLTKKINGTGEGQLKLSSLNGKQFIDAQGKLQNVVYSDAKLQSLEFGLASGDLVAMEDVNIKIKAANITAGGAIIENLSLNATGGSKNTNLELHANAIGGQPWQVHTKAQLEARLPNWQLHIKQLQGDFNGKKISMSAPANITKTDATITPTNLKMKIAEGTLQATGFYSQQNINLKITPTNLPLSIFLGNQYNGKVGGNINITGTAANPKADAAIAINNAQYHNLDTEIVLKNIQAKFTANQKRLELIQATATAGKGSISSSGYIDLGTGYPFSLQLVLKDASIVNTREATGIINGKILINGDISSPLISGNLILGPMEISLPEGSGVDIEAVKINNPKVLPKQIWQEEGQKGIASPPNVKFDLKLEAPAQVFVRGRGLDTEMRGAVTINGTIALPQIEGEFKSVHGTYVLLDRELKITEGTLTFRGPIPPSPNIHMIAETTTNQLTAGVNIEGPIRSPKITLTSTPPRPEDEIMANLLFGRTLASITPLQGIQLAQAVQKLRGKDSGIDFLGKARNLLGIQRLSFGKDESGKFGVEAGKYINDKVYIGVEGGQEPESGKVKTEIEVSPRISVETETSGRASGARLNWKRDY